MHKKYHLCKKLSVGSIPIYLENLATFEESWIVGAQTRYAVIWKFAPIIFCSSLRIFYVKIATSETGGGRGFCISLLVTVRAYWLFISESLLLINYDTNWWIVYRRYPAASSGQHRTTTTILLYFCSISWRKSLEVAHLRMYTG